jgi:hypothetical protein
MRFGSGVRACGALEQWIGGGSQSYVSCLEFCRLPWRSGVRTMVILLVMASCGQRCR